MHHRRLLTGVLTVCLLAAPLGAQTLLPEGRWKTIDDNTGEPKGIVVIKTVNGELQGQVERVFSPPSPSSSSSTVFRPASLANPVCKFFRTVE